MFGTILQRMIFGQLVRVFVLALLSLTGMFLLGGVVAEATQRGLSPTQVLLIIPMLVPNTGAINNDLGQVLFGARLTVGPHNGPACFSDQAEGRKTPGRRLVT